MFYIHLSITLRSTVCQKCQDILRNAVIYRTLPVCMLFWLFLATSLRTLEDTVCHWQITEDVITKDSIFKSVPHFLWFVCIITTLCTTYTWHWICQCYEIVSPSCVPTPCNSVYFVGPASVCTEQKLMQFGTQPMFSLVLFQLFCSTPPLPQILSDLRLCC